MHRSPRCLRASSVRLSSAALFSAALVLMTRHLEGAPPPVDCACVQALPALQTTQCLAAVPDLSVLATNCFSPDVDTAMPGFFTQSPTGGTVVGSGVTPIQFTVADTLGNTQQCMVVFTVSEPPAGLTLTCAPDMTVSCGSPWLFTEPAATTTCCSLYVDVVTISTVTGGPCPRTMTRTWRVYDYCGNTQYCGQVITLVDTSPPVALCSGVNLVPNPGFEDRVYCPDFFSQVESAGPWFNPTVATPDYLSTCATFAPVSVPTNLLGAQSPLSGQAYAGAFMYYETATNNPVQNYREYLETPLMAPLVSGVSYRVSFHVSRAEASCRSVAQIGAHLSTGPIGSFVSQEVLPFTPQVVNPATNLLASTGSWMLVEGVYTATGGEDHVTLGNFLPNVQTTIITNFVSTNVHAYYYFDDIAVVAICPSNPVVACGDAVTFATPIGVDLCSGTNVAVSVLATVTNGSCPRVVTRTWLLTDTCGNTGTWSQAVTILDTTPPFINCDCLMDAAIALLNTNGCTGVIPVVTPFSNCVTDACSPFTLSQSPPPGGVVGAGIHPITVTATDCSGNSNACVVYFAVTPPPPLLVCPSNFVVLTCSNSAIAHYAATASGHAGPITYSPPPGSLLPLGTNTVTCTATSSCGGVASCSFTVLVRPAKLRWGCLAYAIGIELPPVGSAVITHIPDYPGGGVGVNLANLGGSGQDGIRISPGPAEAFAFETELDFDAPDGAEVRLAIPPGSSGLPDEPPLLILRKTCLPQCAWQVMLPAGAAGDTCRTVAIDENGGLFSSFTLDAATLQTNVLASLRPATNVTRTVASIALDCRTREVSIGVPACDWTPDAARKGWDGIIYGSTPRGTKTNKTARLVITPPYNPSAPPVTAFDLLAGQLAQLAFDNPVITVMDRPWHAGHAIVMKAHDDGGRRGLDFTALTGGGVLHADLGFASTARYEIEQMAGGDQPAAELLHRITGWPSYASTNPLPAPTGTLRLMRVEEGWSCTVDYAAWAVSNVTIQLWDGAALMGETTHVAAGNAGPLATVSTNPGIISFSTAGVWTLSATNPFRVVAGLDCGGPGPCEGTELRIIAECGTEATPPVALTDLDIAASEDMDARLVGLQTGSACSNAPLAVRSVAGGTQLSWPGDGFVLQGAEGVHGPWHDLGRRSPATNSIGTPLRVFRLRSE